MRSGRSKDLVAALALLAALGLGSFLSLRSLGAFGATWTDGVRAFSSETSDQIRHAVWDRPEGLAALGDAADPTLSPDGRLLVFTSGERGLNAELFVAEMFEGRPQAPRPLTRLNSPADELAPAFGHGALFFASDRAGGAGGLDIWRVPYYEGELGSVEPVLPGLNSSADETDPACLPGSRTLFFASNRARADFDLYAGTPDAHDFYVIAPLEALNSPADEREPTLSSDPRSLCFASDRGATPGRFGLFRSLRFESGWQTPKAIGELASHLSRRGPWLAGDGFGLWFTEEEPGCHGRTLQHARSLEIFQVPQPAVTLAQWLTLAALLLLALLALLAKRWHALDILYKCLLVSLLLHLLLMLFLRSVVPEETSYETGTQPGPSFRVRLEPPPPEEDGQGLTGPIQLQRARFTAETPPAQTRTEVVLEVPESSEASAPERSTETARSPSSAPTPRLAVPSEDDSRYSAKAPQMALEAATATTSKPSGATAPERARERPDLSRESAPPTLRLAAGAASSEALEAGAPRSSPQAPSAPVSAAPVAQPKDAFERASERAPSLAFVARPASPRNTHANERPEREGLAASDTGPGRAEGPKGEGLVGAAEGTSLDASTPKRARLAASSSGGGSSSTSMPALRSPRGEPAPAAAGERREFDAMVGLFASAGVPPRASTRSSPERAASPGAPTGGHAPPERTPLSPSTKGDPLALAAPAMRPFREAHSSPEVSSNPELRSPFETNRSEPSAGGETFDALTGLTPSPAPRGDPRLGAGPQRAESLPSTGTTDSGTTPSGLAHALLPDLTSGLDSPFPPRFEPSRSGGGAPDSEPTSRTALREPATPSEGAAPRVPSSTTFDAMLGLDTSPASAGRPYSPRRGPRPTRETLAERAAPARAAPLSLSIEATSDSPSRTPPRDLPQAPRLAETPYQNRFGEQKLRALEEFGGTPESEHAVVAGLAYLARIQNENGAWGQRSDHHKKYRDVRIGKTALALLAFLGAGHLPKGKSDHAVAAGRAIDFLLAEQDSDSGHFGQSSSYGHGIATYALAECYALTQETRLRRPLERALQQILRHQSGSRDPRFAGGWGYYFADGHVWNGDEWPRTSVTAWQVMALESARLGGLEVPDRAFERARGFLLEAWDPRARAFRYDHDPARLSSGYPILPASTPAALFALSLLNVDVAGAELAQARRFVMVRMPDGYRYTGDDDFVERARGNLYFWYYATLALFRVGGNEWDRWNSALQSTLLPAQGQDGSWRPLDIYAEYAGDEDEERAYTTAMCVLSLEVYYRYFTPLLEVR